MPGKTKRAAARGVAVANVLSNWASLNEYLRDATEQQASVLLSKEKAGKRRVQYLMRIHGRLNRERARREREELLSGRKEATK